MSSDDNGLDFDFSRRKLLGSMATIGGAAALGGAGSMAFFSDEEEFANNRLVAGSFDLKVDWAEYYSDWSDDEAAAIDSGEMMMAEQGTTLDSSEYPDDYTGLPTPDNALVAIPDEDVSDFMAASATEAYPDTDDDAIVDYPDGYDVCVHGADTPEDLDPTVPQLGDDFKTEGTGLRTENDDTVAEDGSVEPLIAIDDVKPGDFGEVTISAHLCDNDGWLRLIGELVSASENGTTEPERKDPDEDYPDGDTVEFLEQARASVWLDGVHENDEGLGYDEEPGDDPESGNNLINDGEEFLVEEGTLGTVIDVMEGPGISLSTEGSAGGTATFSCDEDLATISGSGGIQAGQSATVEGESGDTTVTINRVRVDGGVTAQFSFSVDGPDELEVGDYPGVCGLTITGTEGTVEVDYGSGGCVRDSILLPRPDQASVGTVEEVSFDFCTLEAPDLQEQDCLNGSDTYYVGFAWWLPVDHGNEVQTDSVAFDLGFYAEQCRHNPDGIGNVPDQ